MVFSRHLYFVDYTQYGCDIQYFNMVTGELQMFLVVAGIKHRKTDPRKLLKWELRTDLEPFPYFL